MYTFPIQLEDHLGGFDQQLHNPILSQVNQSAQEQGIIGQVTVTMPLGRKVRDCYPNLKFNYKHMDYMWESLHNYNIHPELNYKNFICNFNGAPHVSRKLLTAILYRMGYWNPEYCSKNSAYDSSAIDGHLWDYVGDRISFYRKFFLSPDSENFFQSVINQGEDNSQNVRYHLDKNIINLESKITGSFLHVVSETIGTSYYPFVTEKFLFSICTRGLFLAYAQPGWHDFLQQCYGFKLYDNLFDYEFDNIANPVERVIALISMISKFSCLSTHDWHDLYLLEQDNVEFNYDHYYGKSYLKCLERYVA